MTRSEPIDSESGSEIAAQQPLIIVRLIDARKPFPTLATYRLVAIPRQGDLIKVEVSNGVASYRVEFVNFDPFVAAQVSAGCLPAEDGLAIPNEAKARLDEIVRRQMQIFDKAQAYTNAVIVAGYASVFGIWTFLKSQLTQRASSVVALLLGASITIFVVWEIYNMVIRAKAQQKFFTRARNPSEFFEREEDIADEERKIAARYSKLWALTLYPTLATGFGAAAILFYNIAANLLGWAEWP